MPQFPTSKYSASPAPGTFVRAQGSHSPMVEMDPGYVIQEESNHPFKVTLFNVSGTWYYRVAPGTLNGITPTLGGTSLSATPAPSASVSSSVYIYLTVTYSGAEAALTAVAVNSNASVPATTDSNAYIQIAQVTVTDGVPKKVAQPVQTSLWGERLKCGTSDAEYFFARA